MTHLCAWCQHPLPPPQADPQSAATHGLCPACLHAFEQQRGTEVLAWVEEVAHPAVAVDREVRIRAANQAACDLLRADWIALLGRTLCEALGCGTDHPRREGTSQCAVHCLVDRTFLLGTTGAAVLPAPPEGEDPVPFAGHLVTSLRAGDVVALRLDPLALGA